MVRTLSKTDERTMSRETFAIHPDDYILTKCNDSELHWMARVQGLPALRRDIPTSTLIQIVSGWLPMEDSFLADTNQSRGVLEDFITKNYTRVQGQLPGCDGKCRTFLCSEGKHMSCYLPSESQLE
jgi:hypothetical protein